MYDSWIETARTVVIIPAYNEAESLPGVLDDLARHWPHSDVVVVDDGSSDSTSETARDGGVDCLRLPSNVGIGGALKVGFSYAHEHGYERAVRFDADGQHRADQIPKLISLLDEGNHLAVGNRHALPPPPREQYRMGRFRRGAVALLCLEARLVGGGRFTDITSGFSAVAQPLLAKFANRYPDFFLETTFTMVAARRAGFRVAEVPVRMCRRKAGAPSVTGSRLVSEYLRVALAVMRRSRGFYRSDLGEPAVSPQS